MFVTRLPHTARAAVAAGLASIRDEFGVPDRFPADVLDAADAAARRTFDAHVDRTAVPFMTLDPEPSTDLDQAFAIERQGDDLLLHYAIADVGWFVEPGDPIDREAWRRGLTIYMPDGRAPLHPETLSEAAASLLPGVDRAAVVFRVRVSPDGDVALVDVERARIRSRAKLAYETVRAGDLPDGFGELAARVAAAERRRGAGRVSFPEQEVDIGADGMWRLRFRSRRIAEDHNAALSLATNMAVAATMLAAQTGVFRVMPPPSPREVDHLRRTAKALGLEWPDAVDLDTFQRLLDARDPAAAAFLLAVRRASGRATYEPWTAGVTPTHAAMATTYTHATAPLRRLADRFVVEAALAIAAGGGPPDEVDAAFGRLPDAMAEAEARASRVDGAVFDLVEAAVLRDSVGQTFDAVVTDIDERGARIQLVEPAVTSRVSTDGLEPGAKVRVRLTEADVARRSVRFSLSPG